MKLGASLLFSGRFQVVIHGFENIILQRSKKYYKYSEKFWLSSYQNIPVFPPIKGMKI